MGKKNMRKICYNNKGLQYLIEVGEGGGVSPDVEIVKDDEKDGPFTIDELSHIGGLVRLSDQTIIIDLELYNAQKVVFDNHASDQKKIIDDIKAIPSSTGLPDLLLRLGSLIKYLGL